MPPLTELGSFQGGRTHIYVDNILLDSVTAYDLGQLLSEYAQVDAVSFINCRPSDLYLETVLGYLKSSNVARLSIEDLVLTPAKLQVVLTTLRDSGLKTPDPMYRSCPCNHGCRSLQQALSDIGANHPQNFFSEIIKHSDQEPHRIYTCTRVLTHLALSSTYLRDDGCIELARVLPSTQLTSLELSHNRIGDVGCVELARILPSTRLTDLNLSGNEFGSVGIRALCEALETRPELERLNLRENRLDDSSILLLAKSLPLSKLTSLYLSKNPFTDIGFIALGQAFRLSTTMRELTVINNPGITEHGVRQFYDLVSTHVSFRSIVMDEERISLELRTDIYRHLRALHSPEAKVFVALCTPKYVKRVKSKLGLLPVDVIRRLKEFVS